MWKAGYHLCIAGQGKNIFARFVTSGEMGVDLFFILSGFLIGYKLLKEAARNDGDIDYGEFILGRVTRLIFVIVPKAIYILTWK